MSDRLKKPRKTKLTSDEVLFRSLKTQFYGTGWTSRASIGANAATLQAGQRILIDSIKSGFADFIVASRTLCTSYADIFKEWNTPVTTCQNMSATIGHLFITYCLMDASRNHVPPTVMLQWFGGNAVASISANALANAYANTYTIISRLWEQHITCDTSVRDHEKIIQQLSEHDTAFERRNGFVSTPFSLVRDMINKLMPMLNDGDTVIDPAVGRGTFLLVAKQKNLKINVCGIDNDAGKAFITAALLSPQNLVVDNIYIGDTTELSESDFEGIFGMPKFDAVVGNPPYNTPRQTNGQSFDLYPDFVNLAASLAPLVVFVTPSRWFAKMADVKRNTLRDNIVNHYGLKELVTLDSKETFGFDIRGGISYFLLDNTYHGDVTVNGSPIDLKRLNRDYDAIILNYHTEFTNAAALVSKFGNLSQIFHGQTTFGILTNNATTEDENGTLCLFSKQKGGMKRVVTEKIKNQHLLNKWKIVITRAAGDGTEGPEDMTKFFQCLSPGSAVSESFVFFSFDTEIEQKEFFKYITSNVVLRILSECKVTQDFYPDTFRLVPNIRDASLLEPPTVQQEAA